MKLTIVMGTRPEVIKLAPVILEAKRRRHRVSVVLTGQHAHMALPLLSFFGLEPALDLKVMSANQTLTGLSAALLKKMDSVKSELFGDWLVTQGDTTSAFVASYWAFCHRIPVAHVEAGLRTFQLHNPFPEEGNRQLIGRLASLHFAPTVRAREALLREHVDKKRILLTGNTAIDALKFTLQVLHWKGGGRCRGGSERLAHEVIRWIGRRPVALVTAHRRESFGKPIAGICAGILGLLKAEPDLCAVYPVHPNPNVRLVVEKRLGSHPRILLLPPQPYVAFVELMELASLILTDSGGVQEEAPSLRKPILVLRESSERPEGIERGYATLTGTDPDKIQRAGSFALRRGCLGKGGNPYGDGRAAARILDGMENREKRADQGPAQG